MKKWKFSSTSLSFRSMSTVTSVPNLWRSKCLLWPPHAKSWLIGKDSDAGRDWGQEEKGMTEDEVAGWHHWLDGRESEWTPGVGDGQGGLACCDSWGRKESDTTERLNWTEAFTRNTSCQVQLPHICKTCNTYMWLPYHLNDLSLVVHL